MNDAASISRTFHRIGTPRTGEVLVEQRQKRDIRFVFEPLGETGFALLADTSDAIATLEVIVTTHLKGQKKEIPEMLVPIRDIQWTNPNEFPKWDFSRAVQANLTSLKSLEECLCPKGDFCGYQLIHNEEDWFVSQVDGHSTTQYGDFCLVPTYTRSLLLFLKQHSHLCRQDKAQYELHLWTFV